jgi:hypothetical protein
LLALLTEFSRVFPSAASGRSLWLFMLIGFANLPLLFLIGQPRHYQASIIYGQLFLLLGLLGFAYHVRKKGPFWLTMSGLGWGLALACRYNLAISVGVYLVFALHWLWRDRRRNRPGLSVACLLAPLALCVSGLGLYNFSRFGNFLETGLAYQLTLPEFREISYSISYVASNLYVYLLYPLTGSAFFPFIQSAHFRLSLLPARIAIPASREFDQVVFGVFRSVPALWLSGLAIPLVPSMVGGFRRQAPTSAPATALNMLFAMTASAAAGQFAFLLVFFYAAERYVADFYLPAVLCLAIIIWCVDERLGSQRLARALLWLGVGLLTLWTVAIGYFGCFGVPTLVGNFYDPLMLARLASFWNSFCASVRALWH